MIANYCGGVGKTTLALATARRFYQAAGLGTALVEAGNLLIAGEFSSGKTTLLNWQPVHSPIHSTLSVRMICWCQMDGGE